jgi:histidine ammonia-lyase
MLKPLKTSAALEGVKKAIRKKVPYLAKDRHLAPDIEAVHALVKTGELLS